MLQIVVTVQAIAAIAIRSRRKAFTIPVHTYIRYHHITLIAITECLLSKKNRSKIEEWVLLTASSILKLYSCNVSVCLEYPLWTQVVSKDLACYINNHNANINLQSPKSQKKKIDQEFKKTRNLIYLTRHFTKGLFCTW